MTLPRTISVLALGLLFLFSSPVWSEEGGSRDQAAPERSQPAPAPVEPSTVDDQAAPPRSQPEPAPVEPSTVDDQSQTPKDYWANSPRREVARPPLPPRGGWESDFRLGSFATTMAFDRNGGLVTTDQSYNFFSIDVRYGLGLTDRLEVFFGAPYVNGDIGSTSGGGFGDPRLGARVDLIHGPDFFLTLGLEATLPISDKDYAFFPLAKNVNVQCFRAGDPSYDFFPELESRLNLDPISLRFRARYLLTLPGDVNFTTGVQPTDQVIVDLGDGYQLQLAGYLQLNDQWALALTAQYLAVSQTVADDVGLDDARTELLILPGVLWSISPDFDFELDVGYVVAGANVPAGCPIQLAVTSRF